MQTVSTELDHLVIVAASLESGVAYCENILGVSMAAGGEHARMGTHNRLLNLGSGVYLEIIAINPAASAAEMPRWFGMDDAEQRARVADGPFLATFVARTNAIEAASASLLDLGPVHAMQRGKLQWQITIPKQSRLIDGGTVPALIEWPHGVHPTQTLPTSGCVLETLEVFHPQPEVLVSMWARMGLQAGGRLVVRQAKPGDTPHLVASITTPFGTRTIR